MKKRPNLDKEGLEIYLVNLLLAYRPLFQLCGILLIIVSATIISYSPPASFIALSLGIVSILIAYSYKTTMIIAKIGAWLGTVFQNNE